MNRHDALERELMAWFVDTAMPRTPEYTPDIVQLTGTLRQRPRWTFLERWFPMSVVAFRRQTFPSFPWRTVAVLAVLALLLAALVVVVGSQQRLAPPFGLAANGLVAYAQDGDILTVDPTTGGRKWITSGNEKDYAPRWSLDGMRLAFLRNIGVDQLTEHIDSLVIVDRSGIVIAKSEPIPGIDPDAVAWSPDARAVVVGARNGLRLVDAADGSVSPIALRYGGLDVYWRPGDAREILLAGGTAEGPGLVVADIDDPAAATLVAASPSGIALRPNGWTADGRRAVYTRIDEEAETITVHVLDVVTGAEAVIDAAFAHVSNDGTRLLAIDPSGKPCVASIDGGPCIAIGERNHTYTGMQATGAYWAPNDEWVIVRLPESGADRGVLLDPFGGTNEQPGWLVADAESWQRLAP